MTKIGNNFSKWFFGLIIVIFINYSDANVFSNGIYLNSFNFDKFKYEIFTSNKLSTLANQEHSPNDLKCIDELLAIGNGLTGSKPQLWAIKSKLSLNISVCIHYNKIIILIPC